MTLVKHPFDYLEYFLVQICESVITTVNSSDPVQDEKLSKQKSVRFANKTLVEKVKYEEREKLKVKVKLFLNEEKAHSVQDAVFRAMTELGVDFIDVVILSIPPSIKAENEFPIVKRMWQELEKLVEQAYVGGLAVCDFSKLALEQLCNSAKIKPIYDQINLASCCVMPKDLVEYAKKEEIGLLTHADPTDILPTDKLRETINKSYELPNEVRGWRYSWVTSYSVIIKCRTIIQNKGYIVNLVRDM